MRVRSWVDERDQEGEGTEEKGRWFVYTLKWEREVVYEERGY